MQVPFVDLKAQYREIQREIDAALAAVIADTAFIGGKYAKAFEADFAAYIGRRHCVGVGNGTDAIFVALTALGIGSGDEVITAANTFIATSEAITRTGARVVFVDADPDTYNIDTRRIAEAITPRTRAIVPVHLYGQPADMDPILELARQHDLLVVEDAAQAHGAVYRDRRAGTMGICACYSFYPGKNLGAYGDAGAILTDDDELAQKARMLANHGRSEKYGHEFEGVNSRLDGFQGAILRAKLPHLEDWTERRIAVAGRYDEALRDIVPIPRTLDGVRHVFHLYVIRVAERARVQAQLKEHGIATGIHYPIALPFQRAYAHLGARPEDFPVSHAQQGQLLSLPMHGSMPGDQVDYVIENLRKILA
jgi:dTDP-4-amino-4,6-dideoxygalactose transaminase